MFAVQLFLQHVSHLSVSTVTKSPDQWSVLVLTYPPVPADTGFAVGCPQEAVSKILIMSTPRDGSWGLYPHPSLRDCLTQ